MKKLFLIVAIAFILMACNTTAKLISKDLVSHQWKLVEMQGKKVENAEITLQFNEADKTAHGNGGCNNYFGAYTVKGNLLEISNIGATKMSCPETDIIENEYLQTLGQKLEAALKDNRLTLSQDGKAALVFETNK